MFARTFLIPAMVLALGHSSNPAYAASDCEVQLCADEEGHRAAMAELRGWATPPTVGATALRPEPAVAEQASRYTGSGLPDRTNPFADDYRLAHEQFAERVIETEAGVVDAAARQDAGIATREPITLTAALGGGSFTDASETLDGWRLTPEIGLATTSGPWRFAGTAFYSYSDGEFQAPPGTETTDTVGGRVSVGYDAAPALGLPENWFLQGILTVGGEVIGVETARGTVADPATRVTSSGTDWQIFASPLVSVATRQQDWFLSAGVSTVHSLFVEEARTDSAGIRIPRSETVGTLIQFPLDAQRDFPLTVWGENAVLTPGLGVTPAYALTGADPGEDRFLLTWRPSLRLAFDGFSLFADGAIRSLNRDGGMGGRIGVDIPF